MNKIEEARKVMREAFKEDEHFMYGYVANIAMLLHDRYGNGNYITNHEKRNQAAKDILDLVFGKEEDSDPEVQKRQAGFILGGQDA